MTQTQSIIYQKNLEALQLADKPLADSLKRLQPDDRYFVTRAGDGSLIGGIRLDNGQNVALVHTQTPGIEAEDWVKSLGESFVKSAHVMLVGFGAAYHPQVLFRFSDSDTALWFVEPDMKMFHLALKVMDLTDLINSPRTYFAVGCDPIEVRRRLENGPTKNRLIAQGVRLVYHGVAGHLYGNYIQSLQAQIGEAIQMQGVKFKTGEKQGRDIWQNCMANLPYVLNGAPVLKLQSRAAGMPAMVVAPGPSLESSLDDIRAVQDSMLIIAVDTAHRILKRNGIQSDLVVALDYTKLNARHFEGLIDDSAYLVTFPGVDTQIPARFENRCFFFDHAGNVDYEPGATLIFRALKTLGPLGQIVSYGSTAHAAYHVARFMGCMPIILIGNDLAFPGEKLYAPGTMQEEFNETDPDSERLEVAANNGGKVLTRGIYKTYLFDFGPLIQKTGGDVINTAEQGAVIEHAPYVPLKDVLKSIPNEKLDKSFIEKAAAQTIVKQTGDVQKELKQFAKRCVETRELLRPIAKQIRYLDPADLNFKQTMLKSMKALLSLNKSHAGFPVLDLASSLCSRSIVSVIGQYGNVGLLGGDTPEKNQAAIDRCKALFKDLDTALDFMVKELTRAAENLDRK